MRRTAPGRVLLWVFCSALLLFLVAPIAIVMITSLNASPYMDFPPRQLSLRWYANFFGSAQWIEPTLLSLRIALVVTVSSTVLGTLAAIGIVRGRFRGRQGLEMFFISPMVVPVVVLALGLFFLFSSAHLLDKPVALYLGHTLVATPLVIVLVRAGLLKPKGDPQRYCVKKYSRSQLARNLTNEAWLDQAAAAIHQHWRDKNARKTKHQTVQK